MGPASTSSTGTVFRVLCDLVVEHGGMGRGEQKVGVEDRGDVRRVSRDCLSLMTSVLAVLLGTPLSSSPPPAQVQRE